MGSNPTVMALVHKRDQLLLMISELNTGMTIAGLSTDQLAQAKTLLTNAKNHYQEAVVALEKLGIGSLPADAAGQQTAPPQGQMPQRPKVVVGSNLISSLAGKQFKLNSSTQGTVFASSGPSSGGVMPSMEASGLYNKSKSVIATGHYGMNPQEPRGVGSLPSPGITQNPRRTTKDDITIRHSAPSLSSNAAPARQYEASWTSQPARESPYPADNAQSEPHSEAPVAAPKSMKKSDIEMLSVDTINELYNDATQRSNGHAATAFPPQDPFIRVDKSQSKVYRRAINKAIKNCVPKLKHCRTLIGRAWENPDNAALIVDEFIEINREVLTSRALLNPSISPSNLAEIKETQTSNGRSMDIKGNIITTSYNIASTMLRFLQLIPHTCYSSLGTERIRSLVRNVTDVSSNVKLCAPENRQLAEEISGHVAALLHVITAHILMVRDVGFIRPNLTLQPGFDPAILYSSDGSLSEGAKRVFYMWNILGDCIAVCLSKFSSDKAFSAHFFVNCSAIPVIREAYSYLATSIVFHSYLRGRDELSQERLSDQYSRLRRHWRTAAKKIKNVEERNLLQALLTATLPDIQNDGNAVMASLDKDDFLASMFEGSGSNQSSDDGSNELPLRSRKNAQKERSASLFFDDDSQDFLV